MGLVGVIECPFERFHIMPDGRLWWQFGTLEEAGQRKFQAVVDDPSLVRRFTAGLTLTG